MKEVYQLPSETSNPHKENHDLDKVKTNEETLSNPLETFHKQSELKKETSVVIVF